MADWEDIFGTGMSAESVINGVDASWCAERRAEYENHERWQQDRRKAKLTAYLGSDKIKHRFVRMLKSRLAVDHVVSTGKTSPLEFLYPDVDTFSKLECRYCLPKNLTHILDMISQGMIGRAHSYTPGERLNRTALEWLITFFEAIKPGVDLRFVAPKFLAHIAKSTCSGFPKQARKAITPALEIIYARARGVLVQEHLVGAAAQSAWNAAGEKWDFNPDDNNDNLEDAIIASAVELSPSSGGHAVMYSVRLRRDSNEYGIDAEEISYWKDYGHEILNLISLAPTDRLKIIDLNRLEEFFESTNPIG